MLEDKSGKSGAGALLAALSKLPDAMRDDQLEILQQMIQDSIKSPKTETVKCPQCGSSVRQDRLQKHIEKVHPELVQCPECRTLVPEDRLEEHLRQVHRILPNHTQSKKDLVECPVCSNSVRIDNIENHLLEVHNPQAYISRVRQDHNVYDDDDEKGMTISIDFEVANLQDVDCRLMAYFSFPNGEKLFGFEDGDFNDFITKNGQVCVSRDFRAGYENTIYEDFELFIPYDALNLDEGNHQCQFEIQMYVLGPSIFFFSEERSYRFRYNWRMEGSPIW